MKKPQKPKNEIERLNELNSYRVLDTPPEDSFDEITKLAKQICNTKIALVSLIDESRQWFKSKQGLEAPETPRDISYCGHAILSDELFIINDATLDERFCDNPLLTGLPHVRFYAGAPLITPRGLRIGTLCVINDKPGTLTEDQKNALKLLSKSVVNLLELRLQNRKLEDAIERAELYSKAKSDFLANMSHEIRTPLNGVLGMIELLDDTNLTKEQRELVQISKNSGAGLLEIINDILDLSKIESGHLEFEKTDFSLEEFVQDIYNLNRFKAKEKEIDLIFTGIHLEDVFINTDQIRLKQIINNLVSNAIKFTRAGTVEVNIQLDDKLIIQVIDTGIGIDEETIRNLFSPFKQADASITRKFGGTGLGLSICKELTQLFKGNISVTSEVSKGSNFKVEIPVKKVSPKVSNIPVPHDEESLSKRYPYNILIIEDNAVNQKLALMRLAKFGYHCDIANNGKVALGMIKEGIEKNKAYDLIFMDLQMPEMDGFTATKEIRQLKNYNPTIIAMTANVFKEDRIKCKEIGMDDFLSKPFEKSALIEILINCKTK